MERILLALPNNEESYSFIADELDTVALSSENAATQEKVLDLMSSFEPHYFIFENELPGTRQFDEFLSFVVNNYPTITLIKYTDNREEIVAMLDGEIPIPHFDMSFFEPPIEEKHDEEWVQEKEKKKEKEKESQEDWKRLTESNVNLSEHLQLSIAVTGFSGGTGKTETAINLGAWAMKNDFKVALLGFNLQNDNLEERLGIDRKDSKGLVAAHELYESKRLSLRSLEDCMDTYENMKVLVGVKHPEESEEMESAFFVEILNVLSPSYDLVIVDTESNSYSPAWLDVLKRVDHILIPCTTHVSNLYDVQKGVFNLKNNYNVHLSTIDLVLNKAGEGGRITKDIINKNTGLEVIAEIPYRKEFFSAAENETPAVLRMGSTRIKKAMDNLLFRFTGKRNKNKDFIKSWYPKGVKDVSKRLVAFRKSS